ncbi:surface layer protein, partial [mine drainage metagenome]
AVHRYAVDGVYAASGWVADSSGNSSVSDPVAVVVGGRSLTVTLRANATAPAAGAPVAFSATVSGGVAPYEYLFTYGDGTYLNGSRSANATHGYPATGGYCANVIVTDSASPADGGTSAEVAIGVGGAPAPTCPNETSPLTVRADPNPPVRDAPADFPSLFQVVGGTGAPTGERLAATDPYIGACQCTIFRAPGTYTVSLTATDGIGEVASNATNVTVAPALTARFAASAMSGTAPLSIAFSAVAAGGYRAQATRTQWTFGDGTGAVGADVQHTFDAPGLYAATADLED